VRFTLVGVLVILLLSTGCGADDTKPESETEICNRTCSNQTLEVSGCSTRASKPLGSRELVASDDAGSLQGTLILYRGASRCINIMWATFIPTSTADYYSVQLMVSAKPETARQSPVPTAKTSTNGMYIPRYLYVNACVAAVTSRTVRLKANTCYSHAFYMSPDGKV
jgi:hypothetical protein